MPVTRRNMLVLIWAGPACITLAVIGFAVFARFIPPPSPDLTPAEVQELWSHHTNLKRIGMTLCFWGGPLYIPFILAISLLLRRDPRQRALSLTQAGLGIFGTIFVTLNFLILLVVAFRPDRDPDVTQALYDLGFIATVMPAAPFTFQYIFIGLAILQSGGPNPAFPRWVGYFNIWVAVLFLPAAAVPFFKDGLLAWNGLLGFWVPGIVFAIWVWVMFWAMYQAVIHGPDDADETVDEIVEERVKEPALEG